MDAMIKSWHDGVWSLKHEGRAHPARPLAFLRLSASLPAPSLPVFVLPWLDHGIHSVTVLHGQPV